MHRIKWIGVAVSIIAVALAMPAEAQTAATVRVTRRAVVMETPRADSFVLGTVVPGEVLRVLDKQGSWYLVVTPSGMSHSRGWIQASSVELVGGAAPAAAPRRGRMMIRGFGQAGGTFFTAKNSFETIVGTAMGAVYGVGGQVVFPSGAFVQGSGERFVKTGSRVVVSGTQIFTLAIPDTVTVTPIQFTAGYRDRSYGGAFPYLGVGLGWQTLQEESPSLTEDQQRTRHGHVGYHILGGAEFPFSPWLSVAGEVQWTSVPNVLGDTGVSALFEEDDFGGTAFRFKVIVGR